MFVRTLSVSLLALFAEGETMQSGLSDNRSLADAAMTLCR